MGELYGGIYAELYHDFSVLRVDYYANISPTDYGKHCGQEGNKIETKNKD